ncbi:unnamed protein product [Linum tenue]|uniref:Peroxidase n=1 Tax=Linum tenue TaxID=586396 RepID=A0AAV0K931_9ROSI|nr:unnamed protein product [Linum tenue]
MANSHRAIFFTILLLLAVAAAATASSAGFSPLSPYYYSKICPKALPAIRRVVEAAVSGERRMGASLLRLHFHDCFVQGCDGSILLDATPTIDSEKTALPNNNSARGFEVIDMIKAEVDKACGGKPVVSCADILAVAARDSVVALGGPSWEVQLGRRDSTSASRTTANNDIPSPFMDLPALKSSFQKQGLNERDLVALSGGHTIGFSQCQFFRNRIFNETADNIDGMDLAISSALLNSKKPLQPETSSGDANLGSLDGSPARFDGSYFKNLVEKKGLLHSDQALFAGGSTDSVVKGYGSNNGRSFWFDFASSMVKMGNIKPLTGNRGQIRVNCRKVNA